MTRPRFSPELANRYHRAFQDSYEGALHHWRTFLAAVVVGVTVLYGHAFLYGKTGWFTMRKVARETALIEAENRDMEQQVRDLQEQERLLSTNDFVLEKLVRENLRMARPGEMIYLFEETSANESSTGPVEFDDVTVAKRPPERKAEGE
jgi:cell division protein FtsB